MSLTKRLLLGALVWVLCSIAAAGFLLNQLFKQHVEEQLHKELNMHLQQLITQTDVDVEGIELQLPKPLSDPRFEQPLGGMYWQIAPINTEISATLYSRSLWDEKLSPPQVEGDFWGNYIDPELGEIYVVGKTVTFAAEEAEHPTYQFWVAAQEELIAEPLQRFGWMLVLSLAVLGAVLVVGVWWQLRLGLQPLRQLRSRLVEVHEGKSAIIEGQYPQEIQPLVSEFNRVLHSNAQVVERARTQAGNLAHAVKTPLAVLANAAKKENSALAAVVLEQVQATQQQVDYQLSRARVAAAVKTVGVRTAVVPAVQSLSKLLQRAYEHKPVHIEISSDSPELYFKGEAQDLHEILGNVLDNAFKWCDAKIMVKVQRQLITDRSVLCINIEDDGPGLDDLQYNNVFQRGVRIDELKVGSGLGLAIVADLVQLYGGEVSATQGTSLGGLRVEIRLP